MLEIMVTWQVSSIYSVFPMITSSDVNDILQWFDVHSLRVRKKNLGKEEKVLRLEKGYSVNTSRSYE